MLLEMVRESRHLNEHLARLLGKGKVTVLWGIGCSVLNDN